MKFIYLIPLAGLALLCACHRDDGPAPAANTSGTNCPDLALLKDRTWKPTAQGPFTTLRFTSSGKYVENTDTVGSWNTTPRCDSVAFTKKGIAYGYLIRGLSADTLKLLNPTFGGVFTYYRTN